MLHRTHTLLGVAALIFLNRRKFLVLVTTFYQTLLIVPFLILVLLAGCLALALSLPDRIFAPQPSSQAA